MRRLLASALALLVSGCGHNGGGAVALVVYGLLGSALSRASGGCFAVCAGNQVCNPETGFCESAPCGGGCDQSQRCDLRAPVPICVPDSDPADVFQEPPPPAPLPIVTPQP